ncbi:hypothetical protein BOX15_Mlig018324g1 [Macrostomum lignano]|uniref:Malectin domain-containing protein n=2 Tax=Macrostomum lignano TaxID=282301 RepID=A0A1I8ICI2_9PLAT|nr:hypothetical protein BOX15_Mlig018324g1 [Macrostomum lignano]
MDMLPINVITIFLLLITCSLTHALDVIYAVNCGGQEHTDIHGIRYERDTLSVGIPSDYGRNLEIGRVVPQDQILYQTERYHTSSFTYELPIPGDGEYVLVLKFSEVWFANPNQKVFDVLLNSEHVIVSGLDIFARVGRGVAHDEIVPFRVKGDRLFVGSDNSQFYNRRLSLEFVKGDRDNPKINAIVLIKGSIEEVPRLPPIPGGQQPLEGGDLDQAVPDAAHEPAPAAASVEDEEATRRKRKVSGPKASDPYQADPASTALLPVLIAVAAALPLFFCLCKL